MALVFVNYDQKTTFCDLNCDGETLLRRVVCISRTLPPVMRLVYSNESSRYCEILLHHKAHGKPPKLTSRDQEWKGDLQ